MLSSNKIFAATLAATLCLTSLALGAPTAADIATARTLVLEGRKLRAAGEFAKAVEKLKIAYSLYATPVTGDELALAHRDAGQLIEARETALAVVKMPVESDEGKASENARAECAKMISELATRIARVTLSVTHVPAGVSPTVTIDNELVNVAVLAEPRSINPGKHVAVVKAGSVEKSVEFELKDGEQRSVEIVLPETAATPSPTPTPVPTPLPTPTPTPVTRETTTSTGWLTYAGFGAAGAGLVVGSITGLMAMSSSNRLLDRCGRDHLHCPDSETSTLRSYNTTSTLSTIGFVVVGVGLTLGIIDLATGATAKTATVSVGLGGLSLQGNF